MKLMSKEVKLGIIAVLAIIIVYVGIMFLKGLKLFNNDTHYYVKMADVSGLTVAGQVLANGMHVGLIDAIDYNPEDQTMTVDITVKPDFQIPEGTMVSITKEMLGSPRLNLQLGPKSGQFLEPGSVLQSVPSTDLMTSAGEMIPAIQALLPKLDSILSAVNTLVADPALANAVGDLDDITANLKTTTSQLNTLLAKDVPGMVKNANGVLANVQTMTDNLNALDIAGIADNANQTLVNATKITNKLEQSLNSKDNSLGMLMNDNAIALHLDSTVTNASLLLEDLRLHPKRYVHFSLFGRK